MNDHEITRIAAAMHELRPDWPATSLATLIRKNMGDKPRRDVAIALAWVACEANTASPARVLEAGPWWKAAGIEGTTSRREVLAPNERCGICGQSEARCRRNPHAEHDFAPDYRPDLDVDTPSTVARLRELVAATKPAPTEPTEEQADE